MSDVPLLKKGIDKCELPFVGQVFLDDDVVGAIKEHKKFLRKLIRIAKNRRRNHKNEDKLWHYWNGSLHSLKYELEKFVEVFEK